MFTRSETDGIQIRCLPIQSPRPYTLYTASGEVIAENCDPEFLITLRRSLYGTSPNRSLTQQLDAMEPFHQRRSLVSLTRHEDQTMLYGYMWPKEIEKIEAFNKTVASPITIQRGSIPAMSTNNILWLDGVQSVFFPRHKRRISEVQI